MSSKKTTDKTRWLEILAVVLTGLGKFVFMDWLNLRFVYITAACLFWISYIFFRYKADKQILKYWGFTRKNFKETFKIILPFGLISVVAFFIIGHFLGTNILSWHILPLLLLYPIWGTIQQFIIVALIGGNLRDMEKTTVPYLVIILATAAIFAAVHYPFHLLIIGTFLLAILYSVVYLKKKNLFVLGIFHGWLGALFFYTVMARDPFMEVFGVFLN